MGKVRAQRRCQEQAPEPLPTARSSSTPKGVMRRAWHRCRRLIPRPRLGIFPPRRERVAAWVL